ncbi:hypothetical protein Acj133p186 [Acinetobacter phage 133]|uniref:Uncharacterized protein n=1 Tax=Acinetobacter phage 133 TaxID=2919552 RepID=D9I6C0_9CAUD|nr:hypothetical protein Acj133p186 [Acinetobacter phage 133]ADJ19501.1 hypothetical protein Acj133p186 [Acinetobacter phage 133]
MRLLKSRLNVKSSEGMRISIIIDNEVGSVSFIYGDGLLPVFIRLSKLSLEDHLVRFFPYKDRETVRKMILDHCHPSLSSVLQGGDI